MDKLKILVACHKPWKVKNLTWPNPEQLFVAQILIKKVKLKCCGI